MSDNYDLIINAGASYKLTATIEKDLTGYVGRGYIKKSAQDNEPVAEFTVAITPGATSTILITLTAAETEVIPYTGKTWDQYTVYAYDVEIEKTSTGEVSRILQGKASVSPEITKPIEVTP